MRVFVTGATGFIGTHLIPELTANGHQVLGLARSEAGAQNIAALGAEVLRGDVNDLDVLREGASKADGVVHLAFNHDFSRMPQNCADDRRVIEFLGRELAGSQRPFVITSGTAIANDYAGTPATEDVAADPNHPFPRVQTEIAANAAADMGAHVSIVRLAQIHDPQKQGLVPYVTTLARQKGTFAYIGEGKNRWPAAAVHDTARLYRLALEKAAPFARYHAAAEEGVSMRDMAEVIGAGLGVPVISIAPEQAEEHFGWLAHFAGRDMPASSAITRAQLGWNPTGPTLLEDLRAMDYSQV
jgi:nucleoside-diphosphate-sugar epimerase